jgi:hypothetical protein
LEREKWNSNDNIKNQGKQAVGHSRLHREMRAEVIGQPEGEGWGGFLMPAASSWCGGGAVQRHPIPACSLALCLYS